MGNRLGWVCGYSLSLALLFAACRAMPVQVSIQTAPQSTESDVQGTVRASLPPAALHTVEGEAEVLPLSDAAQIEIGKGVYINNCAPCHHANGEGNLDRFPALNRNAFVTVSDPTAVIDTVLHGREVMPAFEGSLTAQEMAAAISYIRNAWNNQASVVSAAQVREVQEETTRE